MNRISMPARVGLAVAVCALSGAAFAQQNRTWVSGAGLDTNPCSRAEPCRTFDAALKNTVTGGEINVLTPGGFGAVTISRSVTIDGLGIQGGILVSGVNAIVVDGAGIKVTLRHLDINGFGQSASTPGLNGIQFVRGSSLTIEDCNIFGFSGFGINFIPSTTAELFVHDSTIYENTASVTSSGGILVGPTGGVTATAMLNNVRLLNNQHGLRVTDGGLVTIDQSVVVGNINSGVVAQSVSTGARATVSDSQISTNGNSATVAGIKASGANALVVIDGNDVSYNYMGLVATNGGQIQSFGTNAVHHNGTDGVPTSSANLR